MHPTPPSLRRPVALVVLAALVASLLAALPATADPQASAQPVVAPTGVDDAVSQADAHAARLAEAGGGPAVAAAAFAAAVAATPGAVPGEVLVTTRDAGSLRAMARGGWQALADAPDAQAQALADRVALVSADPGDLPAVVAALQADPDVLAVEPNVVREFMRAPNDTSYPLQWAHRQTNAEAGWDIATGQGGTPPLIAILDSGVDATHPDLSGNVVASLRSAGGQVIQGAPANDPCGIGHGTPVAGSAAAQGDNGLGIAGVAWQARVIDIALTSPENGCPGGPADSDTITAIGYAASLPEPPLVLNMSLGQTSSTCSTAWQSAIDQARAAGIVVVAAAGNDGTDRPSVPASCEGVISVGATNSTGARASYSQTNPQIDVAAPGGELTGPIFDCSFEEMVAQSIIATSLRDSEERVGGCPPYSDPNGHRLQGIDGTSFASPYVAGVVGLMRKLAADLGQPLSVDETEAILQATARDLGQAGRDCEYGFGIVDLGAALAAVQSGQRPPLQPSYPIGQGSCGPGGATPPGGPTPPPSPPPTPPPGSPCDITPIAGDGFRRVAAQGPTEPVCQAVAVSRGLPDGAAPYAVLARADDFADALAGSAVGLGLGPLLFTPQTGGLDGRTEQELVRVLDRSGGRTPAVFIMGGVAAVPAEVDARLRELGMDPVRVAGDGREATAVAATTVVQDLLAETGFTTRDHVFVAFGRNWPDAVGAGQMAAYYGIPVLLTNTEELHPITRDELQRLRPERVWVLGGTAVVADATVNQIEALGLQTARLAGDGRVNTTLAISAQFVRELQVDIDAGEELPRPRAVALNMDSNFNDILSASLIGGIGNLFLPLAGDGTILIPDVRTAFCQFGGDALVVGGTDRIPDQTVAEVVGLLRGTAC